MKTTHALVLCALLGALALAVAEVSSNKMKRNYAMTSLIALMHAMSMRGHRPVLTFSRCFVSLLR
jgi:hypothetical protein